MNKYKITFTGKIADGFDPKIVKRKLNHLYKGKTRTVELFFKNRPIIVKKNISLEQAEKVKNAFDGIGLVCHVAPMELSFSKRKSAVLDSKRPPVKPRPVQAEKSPLPKNKPGKPANKPVSFFFNKKSLFALSFILFFIASILAYHFLYLKPSSTKDSSARNTPVSPPSQAVIFFLLN